MSKLKKEITFSGVEINELRGALKRAIERTTLLIQAERNLNGVLADINIAGYSTEGGDYRRLLDKLNAEFPEDQS